MIVGWGQAAYYMVHFKEQWRWSPRDPSVKYNGKMDDAGRYSLSRWSGMENEEEVNGFFENCLPLSRGIYLQQLQQQQQM